MPVNNRAFWRRKLTANKARDRFVGSALRRQGWRVVRIWEHELAKRPEKCIEKNSSGFGSKQCHRENQNTKVTLPATVS